MGTEVYGLTGAFCDVANSGQFDERWVMGDGGE